MPGPYDIYSGEQGYYSRLPFGLGSESLVLSAWPDIGLIGIGAIAQRWGIRHGQGKGFFSGAGLTKIGYTEAEKRLSHRMGRMASAASARGMSPEQIQWQLSRRLKTPYTQTVVKPTFRMTIDSLEEKSLRFGRRGRSSAQGIRYWKQNKNVLVRPKNYVTTRTAMRSTTASARGAFAWQWGRQAVGMGVMLGAVQLAAGMADLASSVGQAAIDWRPRRDGPSPYEFGHVYYEPRGAYTQRQRAIMAIHDSQLTTRAAIGGEASFMHR